MHSLLSSIPDGYAAAHQILLWNLRRKGLALGPKEDVAYSQWRCAIDTDGCDEEIDRALQNEEDGSVFEARSLRTHVAIARQSEDAAQPKHLLLNQSVGEIHGIDTRDGYEQALVVLQVHGVSLSRIRSQSEEKRFMWSREGLKTDPK